VVTGNKVAKLAFQAAEVRNRLRIARWLKSPSKRDSLLLIRSWPEAARQGQNPRGFQAWAMAIEKQTVAFNLPPARLQPRTDTPKRGEWASTRQRSAQINTKPFHRRDFASCFSRPKSERAQQSPVLFADSFFREHSRL
jgi:hypothetical protein